MVFERSLCENMHQNMKDNIVSWYIEIHHLWERSDWIFLLIRSMEDYYKKPIELRRPLIFYLGHLPCFSWAQFRQLDDINGAIDAVYDDLFLSDINPYSNTNIANHNNSNRLLTEDQTDEIDWRSFTVQSIIDYKEKVRTKLSSILMNNTLDLHQTQVVNVLNTVVKHEMFHHETLMHLVAQLPKTSLKMDAINGLDLRQHCIDFSLPKNTWMALPAGRTSVGKMYYDRMLTCLFDSKDELFAEPTYVSGFELQSHPVRNGDFLHFILDDGYKTSNWWENDVFKWIKSSNICCPATWMPNERSYSINFVLQREIPIESVLDHPVLVSHVEANAYCRWISEKTGNNISLPTESEWIYAMWDYSNCVRSELANSDSNVNFRHLHTLPVYSNGNNELYWQGSAFEWTSTEFPQVSDDRTILHTRFTYPIDISTNRYFLLLGGSFATDLMLIKKTFRHWCPDTYRYGFSTFRCAKRVRQIDSPLNEDDRKEIIMTLSNTECRSISSKYLYDTQGSALYTQITQLNEYYLFAQELELLKKRANDIRSIILRHSNIDSHSSSIVHLIELGCGDGSKIEAWLSPWIQANNKVSAIYHPLDISQHAIDSLVHLLKKNMGEDIVEQYVKPVCSTFDKMHTKLNTNTTELHVMMLLGSTAGNFSSYGPNNIQYEKDAPVIQFFSQIRRNLKVGDWFVCAFDMCKDIMTMIRAYNDSKGVTAAFTYNLLERLNRELNFNFNSVNYEFYSTYNPIRRRIESCLISTKEQTVTDQHQFVMTLKPYDVIHTEISTKYTREDIQLLMEKAFFNVIEYITTDNDKYPYTICLARAI